ncbi:MAG TPA: hypothetical protein VN372_09390 [Methanospirillum sp.]|nr:hypothetical protein [Methanospirillum sp.]
MVLEEKLIVSSHEEAKDIVQYLKSLHISSRIISEPVLKTQLTIAGTYAAIKGFLAEYPNHLREQYVTATEEERALIDFESPDDEIWTRLPGTLDSYHSGATELLDGVLTGDFVCSNLYNILNGKDLPGPDADLARIERDLEIFRIFNLNEIVEVSTSGIKLVKSVSADDITYYIPYNLKFSPGEEICEKYQITTVRSFTGKMTYAVIMGAEALLHPDHTALFYELAQRGIDTAAMFEHMDHHINKTRVLSDIINTVMEGEVSLEVLKESFFDDPSVCVGEGILQNRSDYSPEFIEEVVADLRKIDVIRGKDQRLKPGRALSSKKSS